MFFCGLSRTLHQQEFWFSKFWVWVLSWSKFSATDSRAVSLAKRRHYDEKWFGGGMSWVYMRYKRRVRTKPCGTSKKWVNWVWQGVAYFICNSSVSEIWVLRYWKEDQCLWQHVYKDRLHFYLKVFKELKGLKRQPYAGHRRRLGIFIWCIFLYYMSHRRLVL